MTIGSCLETDSCTAGVSDSITRYDLTGLAKIYEEMNILSRIDTAIREYGDYLAALVLVIMAIRMMVHLTVMVMAYLQGGPAMALAIILTTCCGASETLQKMKRRRQRTEELPLQTPRAKNHRPSFNYSSTQCILPGTVRTQISLTRDFLFTKGLPWGGSFIFWGGCQNKNLRGM